MRISLLIITLLFSTTAAYAQNSCHSFLKLQPAANSNKKQEEVDLKKQEEVKTSLDKTLLSQSKPVERALSKAEDVIDLSLELKILTHREAEHLRSDIKELRSEENPKENLASFNDLVSRWEPMIFDVENKLKEFQALSKAEQKQWKSKMELPVYFATAHFIVLLEARNKKFEYSKMSNILDALEGNGVKDDLKLYLFVFEKQVRRFFSVKEFRRCRA